MLEYTERVCMQDRGPNGARTVLVPLLLDLQASIHNRMLLLTGPAITVRNL